MMSSDSASSSSGPVNNVSVELPPQIKVVEGEGDEEDEEEDEPVDPRIKVELDTLNCAAESINKLENEVQKARAKFRMLKAESSQRLGGLYKKIGRKYVMKARPYYDLQRQSIKAQTEAQKAAVRFQRSTSVYRAAKETVTLAEQQLTTEGGEKLAFDSAWQEMLNHATMRFMDAEKEKRIAEREHELKASAYNVIQQRLAFIVKDMSRTITKSKPFYELKDKLENRLQAERQNAEDLHLALICSKQKYKMALSSLENISEEVHTHRVLKHSLDLPLRRTPGVGAESDTWSEVSEMPSITLDFMSETASQASFDDFSDTELDFSEFDYPDIGSTPPSPLPHAVTSSHGPGGLQAESSVFVPFWNSLLSRTSPKPSSAEPLPLNGSQSLSSAGKMISFPSSGNMVSMRSDAVYVPSSIDTRTLNDYNLVREDLLEGAEGYAAETPSEHLKAFGSSTIMGMSDKSRSTKDITSTPSDIQQSHEAVHKGGQQRQLHPFGGSPSPMVHSASFHCSSNQPTTFQYTPATGPLTSRFNDLRFDVSSSAAASRAVRPSFWAKPPRPGGRDNKGENKVTPLRTSSSSPRLFFQPPSSLHPTSSSPLTSSSHPTPTSHPAPFSQSPSSLNPPENETIAQTQSSNQESAIATTTLVASPNESKDSSVFNKSYVAPNYVENHNFNPEMSQRSSTVTASTAPFETLP